MIDSFNRDTGIYNGVPFLVPDNPLYPPVHLKKIKIKVLMIQKQGTVGLS